MQHVYNATIETVKISKAYEAVMKFGQNKATGIRGASMLSAELTNAELSFDDLLGQMKMEGL